MAKKRTFVGLLLASSLSQNQGFQLETGPVVSIKPNARFGSLSISFMGTLDNEKTNSPQESYQQPAHLVNGKAFRSAIETLKMEMAKEQGIQYEPEDTSGVPSLIGRLEVELPIPPEIELIETPSMVLIHRLSVKAQELGINPLDTITSVSTLDGGFKESVKQMNLENMASILTKTINIAEENGDGSIRLEINRLMQAYYTEEPINDERAAGEVRDHDEAKNDKKGS